MSGGYGCFSILEQFVDIEVGDKILVLVGVRAGVGVGVSISVSVSVRVSVRVGVRVGVRVRLLYLCNDVVGRSIVISGRGGQGLA